MMNCSQTNGQSTYQHGISVKKYTFDLINHLRFNENLKYKWLLPDWVASNRETILSSLPDDNTIKFYTVFHDCGKWKCLQIDADGKRHFPNHAEISYKIFNQVFNNPVAAELILHDMDIHLLKSDGVVEFCQNPYALTLLLTGLAELHSNAQMFGGLDSTSFKIKWKSISQRGKQIFNQLKNKN